jgi:hypothetical protein
MSETLKSKDEGGRMKNKKMKAFFIVHRFFTLRDSFSTNGILSRQSRRVNH